jgi:hypothetical protein
MIPYLNILGSLLEKVIPDKAELAKAKTELVRAEVDGRLRETEIQLSAIIAEARSADPFTSRARPMFLYVMYTIIASCFFGGIVGIWYPEHVAAAAVNIQDLLAAIPEPMWWLFGSGYLGYTGMRTVDKMKAGKQ